MSPAALDDRVKQAELKELDLADCLGAPDVYIDGENDTAWAIGPDRSTAYTVAGNWGYHEYSWKGKPGDYITEMPGTVHTPWMGESSEVIFDVAGSIEFFNDDDTLRETMDGFRFWRLYVEHCEKHKDMANMGLWY